MEINKKHENGTLFLFKEKNNAKRFINQKIIYDIKTIEYKVSDEKFVKLYQTHNKQ